MNKNFKKLTLGALSFILLLSASSIDALGVDFSKPDPNCPHEHVEETFNQAFPCEFGNVEDTYYIYCQDCGGLLKEKTKINMTQHRRKRYVDEFGVKRCELCNRPINEKVDLVKGVMKKEDIPKYTKKLAKIKEELYPQMDYKKQSYEEHLKEAKKGFQDKGKVYTETKFLTGENKSIRPLDLSKIDEDLNCKGEHTHLVVTITQIKNKEVTLAYQCLDCAYKEYYGYQIDEFDTEEKREELSKDNKELREFWQNANLLSGKTENSKKKFSLFGNFSNFFKNLFK